MENIAPTGAFIAYKMVKVAPGKLALAKLEIPAEARRVQPQDSVTVRVDRAKVIDITDDKGTHYEQGVSFRDPECIYRVGALTTPHHAFDPSPDKKSASGIHVYFDPETDW